MKKINKLILTVFATTGLLFGCEDLDVRNANNPDFAIVFATAEDVESVASGLYNTVFQGEHNVDGIQAMLATSADHSTCSWGNFGMRDMSWEPRDFAWDNTPTYANQGQTKYSYDQWYSAIASASNVLRALTSGVEIGDRAHAFAKFALGLAYGDMAMVYDRVHIVDDVITVDEETLATASSYQDVTAASIGYLEEALAVTNGSTFTIPASWLGTTADLTSVDFAKVINTSIARILSYVPRNSTELAAVDWDKVQTHADAGITSDWLIKMDASTRWYMEAGDYLTYPGWARTDMYVVNMMEPSLPQHWDDDPDFPHPAEPTDPLDNRLETDFQYLASNDFNPTRGYYHFSCYRSKRYDDIYATANGLGTKPTVMLAENEMLRAEARAYTGDLAGAAEIINEGTRVTRGGLDPVAENLQDIIDAIHHERHVEMFTTGAGIQFFEMRKLDLLQTGTPLHLPIPGQTQQLLGESSFYTFGRTANADGVGTSDGGWR